MVVVEGEKLRPLLPELPRLNRQSLAHPVELLRDLEGTAGGLRLQLLPYRAVGVECGLLLALRVNRANCGGGEVRGLPHRPLSHPAVGRRGVQRPHRRRGGVNTQ